MFNFFKRKHAKIKIIDKIVIDESAKLEAMLANWAINKNNAFIFWFDESLEQASTFFSQTNEPVTLLTAREARSLHLQGKTAVFAEHYPLFSKEEALYQEMNLTSVTVFSSLNEPLFKLFGADKIIQLMKQLGMKENEVIEHKMISQSIRNAQEKIEKKVLTERLATSQSSWLEKNLKS